MITAMNAEGSFVTGIEILKCEVMDCLRDIKPDLGTMHLSARWEPAARIAHLGVCIENYTWKIHEDVIKRLVQLQLDHKDDFAVEFDVIPIEGVRDDEFAEA